MSGPALLIAEDNTGLRESLLLEFTERGYAAHAVADARKVETELEKRPPDFAIVDLKLGTANGLDIVKQILAVSPTARIVVLTGYASLSTAVEAIKLGAVDYLEKPVNIDRLERSMWGARRDTDITEDRISLARHEREYIEYVLQQCNGNITRAAKWLGIHRQSLQRKLRKYTPR